MLHSHYQKWTSSLERIDIVTALTTEQAMERFQIKSITTITELFKKKGSPAYKVGAGRGHWRVDEEDFKKFLQKESEQYKG